MASNDSTTSSAGATPTGSQGGATPPDPSNPAGGTPTGTTPAPDAGGRDAHGEPGANGQGGRDAHLPEGARRALEAERARTKELEQELGKLKEAEQKRIDAQKSELQLAQERAATAEAKAATLEREALARQVAAEAGIAAWWDKLEGDDLRALRADATRLRERLGLSQGGMDGGVRGVGPSTTGQPSMDDLIRAGARR